jgi:hypothetical protein
MAAARCKKCGKPERGKPRGVEPGYSGRRYYTGPYYPVAGFELNPAIICGKRSCEEPAEEIWLKEEEEARYRDGIRIFDLNNYMGGKIKLADVNPTTIGTQT